MKIAIASDHAGFPLKEEVRDYVRKQGHEVEDLGAYNAEPSDYPDFALLVGKALMAGKVERGILICGSGVGVCVAANKMPGVRAGMCHDTYSAHQGVEHDETGTQQEEVNVVVAGSGVYRVEGEEIPVTVGSVLRFDPETTRQPVAGPDGLTMVAVGARRGSYEPRGPF